MELYNILKIYLSVCFEGAFAPNPNDDTPMIFEAYSKILSMQGYLLQIYIYWHNTLRVNFWYSSVAAENEKGVSHGHWQQG